MVEIVVQDVLDEDVEVTGTIGSRHLVCVQTLDIARLTPHPVALVPGFVAVSGKGSRNDSNESGKTNWLSAVSLLLGDPEWSLHSSSGAQNTSTLLFDPVTAGVEGYPRADHGYVVGVFAARGDLSRPVSVWLRINDSSPYLKVRWRDGVVLAEGETTHHRHRHADEQWASLPADSELGAQKFAERLYGPSPRALAYVSSRGDRQSGASLLKMQAGGFRPDEIGAQLIRLTGRQAAFEKEEKLRAELDAKQRRLTDRHREDAERLAREEANLEWVKRRVRAREHVALASESWELHFARGLLEVLEKEETLKVRLRGLEESLVDAQKVDAAAKTTLDELAAPDELRRSCGVALDRETLLDAQVQGATTREVESRAAIQRLADRERELAEEADGWTDLAVERYEDRLAQAERAHRDASDRLAVADARLAEAQTAHGRAVRGEGGGAGDTAAALRADAIDADVLADVIEVHETARDQWEPRLVPYADAIVVAQEDLDRVLAHTATRPGTMLVASARGELPDGIRSAPAVAAGFLTTLAARAVAEPSTPPSVHDSELGLTVVGGFAEPQIGRAARIEQALQAQRAATAARDSAAADVATTQGAVELAHSDLRRAEAARVIETLRPERQRLEEEYAAAEAQLHDLRPQQREAQAEAARLRNQVDNLENLRLFAEGRHKDARSRREQAEREVRAATDELDRLGIDYWRSGWGRSDGEARDTTAEVPLTVKRLRNKTAEEINKALNSLEVDAGGDAAVSRELAAAARSRSDFVEADDEEPSGRQRFLYDAMIEPLRAYLSQYEERDEIAAEQIALGRAQRDAERATAETECEQMQHGLDAIQDALEHRLEQSLRQISDEFNRLNRQGGGFGATLRINPIRPQRADDLWQWEVTPCWRRSQTGSLLPYTNRTNTAQEKLYTVHLVLAALLAAPNPHGRVLILDELGDSLGENHRREAIRAIAETAHASGVSVLGTCQDSVLEDAMDVADELLFFEYPRGEAYNRPTRMWGFSDARELVELTAESVAEGRAWW